MSKVRIDKLLVDRKLAPSRERAQALIMAGLVLVNNVPVTKAGQTVKEDAVIRIHGEDHPFVGRGGVKLEYALKEFKIEVKDKICADIGASTGGFTDCLLQHGAKKVYAIDVGYGQLAWKIRQDGRVVVMERQNVRDLEKLPDEIELCVIDVSFISLDKVFPHVDKFLDREGAVITLIKPQFEVGRGNVGKGGIVKDPKLHGECVKNVCNAATSLGWQVKGTTTSPIKGADGNVEFLAWFVKR